MPLPSVHSHKEPPAATEKTQYNKTWIALTTVHTTAASALDWKDLLNINTSRAKKASLSQHKTLNPQTYFNPTEHHTLPYKWAESMCLYTINYSRQSRRENFLFSPFLLVQFLLLSFNLSHHCSDHITTTFITKNGFKTDEFWCKVNSYN